MIFTFLIISLILSITIFFVKKSFMDIIGILLYSIVLILFTIFAIRNIGTEDSIYFKFDELGVLMASVLSLIAIGSFYHSFSYLKRKAGSNTQNSIYFAATIMFVSAMMSAYFTQNFAVLWASIEATTLFISILIFHTRTKSSIEATWKYLYISSIGLAIAFIGILFLSIIASNNGINNLNFTNLISACQSMDVVWLKVAFVLILTGLSVKINLFPLYTVAIDAKSILASPINALMSTALINVGFVGIYRIYSIIAQTGILLWAQHILMIVGVVSIIITSIQLMRVKRMKRLLAFSSMEHMGLVFLGLATGGIGYYAAILHLVFHSFVKAGLFFQLGSIRSFYKSIWIKDNGRYFTLNNWGALAFLLGIISILAIPPSGLFISELMIFKSLFASSNYLIAIFVLILLSVIIFIIAKNSFHLLYADVDDSMLNKEAKANPIELIIQFSFFALVIYLGINPPLFFTNLIHAAIAVLN